MRGARSWNPGTLPQGFVRRLLVVAGITLVYTAAGRLGLALSTIHESASPVWPPTGIAIASVLLFGFRVWPAFLAGAFLFNFTTSQHATASLGIASGNTLEALVAGYLAREFTGGRRTFERVPGILGFSLLAGGVATSISATVGVTSLTLAGLTEQERFAAIWTTWWVGNAAGAILLTPAIVLLATPPRGPRAQSARLRRTWVSLLVPAVVVLLSAVLFHTRLVPSIWGLALVGALVLLLLSMAATSGPRRPVPLLVAVAALCVWGTNRGLGPFVPLSGEALLLVDLFLAAATVAILCAGAMAQDRGQGGFAAPARPFAKRRGKALALSAITLVPLLGGTMAAGYATRDLTSHLEEHRFDAYAAVVAQAFRDHLQGQVERLYGLKGGIDLARQVDREVFEAYVLRSGWFEFPGGTNRVAFIRFVEPDEKAAYEAAMQRSGVARFTVHPEGSREAHYVVEVVVPLEGNEGALGFDAGSEEARQETIRRAIDSGLPRVTAPIAPIGTGDDPSGFAIVLPVYEDPAPNGHRARREGLVGFVTTVHSMEGVIDAVTAALEPELGTVRVGVRDVGRWAPQATLAAGADSLGFAAGSQSPAAPGEGRQARLEVYGRAWELSIDRPGSFLSASERAAPWVAIGAGGVIDALLIAVVYLSSSAESRAREMADRMTLGLRRAERRFRSLLEAAPDAMVIADGNGNVRLVNAQAERLFGYSREELAGESLGRLLDPRSGGWAPEQLPTAAPVVYETVGRRKEGVPVPIEVSLSPVRTDEGVLVAAAVRDVTERHRADDEMRAAHAEREVLLKEVHHRVKNNLQVISSLLDLQSDHAGSHRACDALRESRNRVRAIALVHEKLYGSRRFASIDAEEYLHDLTQNLLASYAASEQGVALEIDAPVPIALSLERSVSIGLAVSELVSNALKHAFHGRDHGRILLRILPSPGGGFTVVVCDDGVGLPPGFDVHATPTLGLQLVLLVLQQFRGRLEVESHGGTTFRLQVPPE